MFRKMNMLMIILVIGIGVSLPPADAFVININAGAGLSGNADALAAFNRGAAQWTKYFNDPITVTIDADLAALGAGIIGQASSVMLADGYTNVRSAMVVDAAPYANNSIVASLPTAAQFLTYVPAGGYVAAIPGIAASKANLKALGYTGLDAGFGVTDATIQFSSNFSFDYNNSNGVTAGTIDFETVAAHEIGHALGFFSAVDSVDYLKYYGLRDTVYLNPLDLFRFRTADVPATAAQFTSAIRSLEPGVAANFSDTNNVYGFSTGYYTGDGRQASHWKDDDLTGTWIGLMDPTLAYGVSFDVAAADVRSLDLIGYDLVPAPLPASLWLLGSALIGLLGYAQRRQD